MDVEDEGGEYVRKLQRKIRINFFTCFSGIFFSFSAFRALFDIQTSINIQEGLGTASGTTITIAGISASLTITPMILIKLGPKVSLIWCEINYLLYVVANFHPVYGTMIPGSMLAGMAESLVFPAMSIYSVYFATAYAEHGSKKKEEYISDFAGKFFSIVYLTHLTGNLIAYVIMRRDISGGTGDPTLCLSSNSSNVTLTNVVEKRDLSVCGANDCQDPNITSDNLSQYVAEKTTTYILLSVFCAIIIVAILIHWCLTPAIRLDEYGSKRRPSIDDNPKDTEAREPRADAKLYNEVEPDENRVTEVQSERATEESERTLHTSVSRLVFGTLKGVIRQLRSHRQLLLAGIQFYTGIELSVTMADITRAYISCAVGVQQTGLGLIAYGALSGLSCLLCGRFASRFGRNIPLFAAFVVDMASYIFCLCWQPTQQAWPIFVLCGAFGFTSGIWQTLTNAMCADYFREGREIAFTVWNTFILAGMALQFGWSTLLCVDTKLYADIAILCFAVITYGIAEIKYQRSPPRTISTNLNAEHLLRNENDRAPS